MDDPTTKQPSRRRSVAAKLGVSAVTLAMLAGAAGTYAAFTATTVNNSNSVTSGTVDIDQHASAAAVISATGLRPTTTVDAGTGAKERCIRVTYSGTLEANVRFYVSSAVTNGTAYNVKVERGSGLTTLNGTMSCAGFVSGSTAYDGALGSLPTSWTGPPVGVDGKAAAATWATSNTVDYRFTISANDDTTPNAHEQSPLENFPTGTFSITWEARNTG